MTNWPLKPTSSNTKSTYNICYQDARQVDTQNAIKRPVNHFYGIPIQKKPPFTGRLMDCAMLTYTSKRSASITLTQAATKSFTNFALLSSCAYTSA